MARARNIKPGFFTNDLLAECSIEARLLFAGLWTIADRAGRLEDRHKKIKAELLPYDNVDCDNLLKQLHNKGFIHRYRHNDIGYIQILNFEKHQNPHCKEQPSTIPAPDKHQTRTEVATPITDSLNLIPDSNSVTNVTGTEVPPPDFKKVFFSEGLKMLGGDTKPNRSLIGQWLRDYGESTVGGAFMAAQKQSAVEPKAYIIKTLRESHANSRTNNTKSTFGGKPTWRSEGERLAAKYGAEAERLELEEQTAADGIIESNLRLTETIRENPS